MIGLGVLTVGFLAAGMSFTLAGQGPTTAPATAPAAIPLESPSAPPFVSPDSTGTLKTLKDLRSYCLGVETARGFKRGGMDIDLTLLARGMKEAMDGDQLLLPDKIMQGVMSDFVAEMRVKMTKARLNAAEDNKKAGAAFLAANKEKTGVVTLPSGLQYKILKAGTGPKPTEESVAVFFYRGTLIDGTEFDSTTRTGKPATLKVSDHNLISGFREALKLMPVGSKWQIFIPCDLAYGPMGSGRQVGPNATLIYDVELVALQ
jgi:FKBP-type peptidyl-prolyl cis-trans isomerase FklB